MASPTLTHRRPVNVLVIGANGYLGSAVCRAFLRAAPPQPCCFFRVYGLVRRQSTAPPLGAEEVIPIVGSVSETETLTQAILSHSVTWDVIVICTEPSKTDSASEEQHWNDLLTLVQRLSQSSAKTSQSPVVRPMVLWSSGCKDYGTTKLHGDEHLTPHTETSALVPHALVRGRMMGALHALETCQAGNGEAEFDVAIIRATPLYGYSSSYYSAAFDYMEAYAAAVSGKQDNILKLPQNPGTIMHGIHVDDCGDAYVALAKTAIGGAPSSAAPGRSTSGRKSIAGEAFNISSGQYETLGQVGAALAAEYGFTRGVQFNVKSDELPAELRGQETSLVFGYSQWVSSEKIRAVTGWNDMRPLFHQNIKVFRNAYHATLELGSDNIRKTRQRMAGNWGD
ncbi:hypothetical protein K4F52_009942 [Lecanicillium sp. MT-2017a]|nr:hypothetical protein K4F52_009942 [Lecanicillium sp. MT-2017a]